MPRRHETTKGRFHPVTALGIALMMLVFAAGVVRAGGWAFLGERTVRDRLDHDTIPVTVTRGGFRAIKFSVRGHGIGFHKVQVRYADGAPDIKAVSWMIPVGGESREIPLRGANRAIRYIDFWYDAKSLNHTPALIRVYGIR